MIRNVARCLPFLLVMGVGCHRPSAVPVTEVPVKVGGGCTYDSIPGQAEITRVTWEGTTPDVRFTFIPDAPSPQSGSHQIGQDRDQPLQVGGGMTMTREWLETKGIRPGVRLRATRKERTRGTCAPVVYAFPSIPEAF